MDYNYLGEEINVIKLDFSKILECKYTEWWIWKNYCKYKVHSLNLTANEMVYCV